ncbi:MAG: hypothetical protein AAF661_15215 [Pseudomonadota bacterium]
MAGIGRSIGLIGLATSCLLVGALFLLVFRKGYDPGVVNGAAAMWGVAYVAMGMLAYVTIQAAAALSHPPRRLTVISFLDITFSFVPVIVCAIAAFMWTEGLIQLSNFQMVVLALAFVATMLDLIFFALVMYFSPHVESKPEKPAAAKKA